MLIPTAFPQRVCGVCLAILLTLALAPMAQLLGPTSWPFQRMLELEGYSVSTPEEIIEIYNTDASYNVRGLALGALAKRVREQAIPTLKEALSDERVELRIDAAKYLFELGDRSALQAMQEGFDDYVDKAARLARGEKVDEKIGPVYANENYYVGYALSMADVLAKLGDYRGYELAALKALKGQIGSHRSKAFVVLGEIAKADASVLEARGMDPVLILCAAAESERENSVFGKLLSVAPKLDEENAKRIVERMCSNPFVSDEYWEKAAGTAKYVADKAEWARRKALKAATPVEVE